MNVRWHSLLNYDFSVIVKWSIRPQTTRKSLFNTTVKSITNSWLLKTSLSTTSQTVTKISAFWPTQVLVTLEPRLRTLTLCTRVGSLSQQFGLKERCLISREWLTRWRAVREWWRSKSNVSKRDVPTRLSWRICHSAKQLWSHSSVPSQARKRTSLTCKPALSKRMWTLRTTESWSISLPSTTGRWPSTGLRKTKSNSTLRCCRACLLVQSTTHSWTPHWTSSSLRRSKRSKIERIYRVSAVIA